jgi:hypothetical protein
VRRGGAILVAAALPVGCALSAGSGGTDVGRWRARQDVDTVVCVEAAAAPGKCDATMVVGRDTPARSFRGGTFSAFNTGYMRASRPGGLTEGVTLDNSFEYVWGRGGLAVGGRLGANVGFATDLKTTYFTLPLSLIGHWGYPRWSVYAGGGGTPYAREKLPAAGDIASRRTLRGFHLLGGARVVVRRARVFQTSLGAEVGRQWLGDVDLTTVTANVGLAF